ncbi:MAG: NADH-quinone oxidoreductase subunit J [Chloroflexi bacterium]|nr:NADH-quinone oxidoreductase subunit J [Chloroflexota bacterium]
MTGSLIAFAFLAALTLAGGLGVVLTRNVAYSALALLLTLAAVAGIFILLLAEFLALVQILIYGGAIVIVLLFALMLTRLEEFSSVSDNPQRPLAAVAALAILGVLVAAFAGFERTPQPLEGAGFQRLGNELFTQWAIPFEVASLVLLVALIGAFIIAQGRRERE